MNVSRNWLQTFFDAPLPPAERLEELLTFHSSEIEEVRTVGDDAVLDVKVLPDKSAWMLSHRGVARELATILELPMRDPLATRPELLPATAAVSVSLDADYVSRYTAAVIRGVKIGPSPEWLVRLLAAVGQRSINNVVDATNYVLFHLGQPLHAFDMGKLGVSDGVRIGVRMARERETITALTGDTYTLSTDDMLIVDGTDDTPIGIAGVKGGAHAAVDDTTTDIVIESAHFDRVSIRKTAQRLKLRTDASSRYENGIVPEMTAYGLVAAVELIIEIAGGTLDGYVDVNPSPQGVTPVSVSLEKINSVLGLTLTEEQVLETLARFGYESVSVAGVITVTPPFERIDLVIPEDLIEEIGRIYGLEHVPSVAPEAAALSEYNKRFFYTERVRAALCALGFSEVYTSSFQADDVVRLENALASDKGCLRSTLRTNISDALTRNVVHKDLLGLARIAIFEIGTVFDADGEHFSLALGVRTDATYRPKKDDALLQEAIAALGDILGAEQFEIQEGVAEVDFDAAIADLPEPVQYDAYTPSVQALYKPFSSYPFIARDIALWVSSDVAADQVEQLLAENVGELCVRITLFDAFKKDDRTSYAFRLVFQSYEKTLTDEAVASIMEAVYTAVAARGWEVR